MTGLAPPPARAAPPAGPTGSLGRAPRPHPFPRAGGRAPQWRPGGGGGGGRRGGEEGGGEVSVAAPRGRRGGAGVAAVPGAGGGRGPGRGSRAGPAAPVPGHPARRPPLGRAAAGGAGARGGGRAPIGPARCPSTRLPLAARAGGAGKRSPRAHRHLRRGAAEGLQLPATPAPRSPPNSSPLRTLPPPPPATPPARPGQVQLPYRAGAERSGRAERAAPCRGGRAGPCGRAEQALAAPRELLAEARMRLLPAPAGAAPLLKGPRAAPPPAAPPAGRSRLRPGGGAARSGRGGGPGGARGGAAGGAPPGDPGDPPAAPQPRVSLAVASPLPRECHTDPRPPPRERHSVSPPAPPPPPTRTPAPRGCRSVSPPAPPGVSHGPQPHACHITGRPPPHLARPQTHSVAAPRRWEGDTEPKVTVGWQPAWRAQDEPGLRACRGGHGDSRAAVPTPGGAVPPPSTPLPWEQLPSSRIRGEKRLLGGGPARFSGGF
ncbi:collagen alpha-1(I) chain-like [Poecile atricapillus]|uniref:collagen alpha-1(I) chain-like n=1 Tax=Poecile atricapillus TaxID=48891 RepID=UPI002739D43D|nr:collagen alpha-1(I) chain-like [Poecile atricapillus]